MFPRLLLLWAEYFVCAFPEHLCHLIPVLCWHKGGTLFLQLCMELCLGKKGLYSSCTKSYRDNYIVDLVIFGIKIIAFSNHIATQETARCVIFYTSVSRLEQMASLFL